MFGRKRKNKAPLNEYQIMNEMLNEILSIDNETGQIKDDIKTDLYSNVETSKIDEMVQQVKLVQSECFVEIKKLKENKEFKANIFAEYIKEHYTWVNKKNVHKLIGLGLYNIFINEE